MRQRVSIAKAPKYDYKERRELLRKWRRNLDARIATKDSNYDNRTPEQLSAYLRKLPALAKDLHDKKTACGWGPKLRELILGTRDVGSPLSLLGGFEDTIVRNSYSYIGHEFSENVTLTIPSHLVGNTHVGKISRYTHGRDHPRCYERDFLDDLPRTSRFNPTGEGQPKDGFVAFATCGSIVFPEPADRNVNMLPFIFGDEASLPDNLKCFYNCIEECPYPKEYIGEVGYLTVHESYVEAGAAQRREGLHIEAPSSFPGAAFTPGVEHRWGMGIFYGPDMFEGGIYMASSVDDTSEVWDALVHKDVPGIVDRHGGCEHLRSLIGPGTKLRKNELIWMTDCTPHQALLQEKSGVRQFFRVVTPSISHWFAAHSTPNPLVPLPENVIVVETNKFA